MSQPIVHTWQCVHPISHNLHLNPNRVLLTNALICPNLSSRSEEHTSELQSQSNLVCRLLLEKKKTLLLIYFARRPVAVQPSIASNIILSLCTLSVKSLTLVTTIRRTANTLPPQDRAVPTTT